MATPGSLVCCEEMMEESPDVSAELEERKRYKDMLPPQIIRNPKPIMAFHDKKLSQDERLFPMMLQLEKLGVGYVNNYFRTIQDDLTPSMKWDVAIWMFEVCDEERQHTAVFIRAIQYMDKYLSRQRIARNQLQLLGAVCILISSKMAGTTISARTLVHYTANSITSELLLDWERLVLSQLQWDMNGIVSSDFVQHILNLLPKQWWDNSLIFERIKTFVSYCAVDHLLGVYLPSTVAAASIIASLSPFLNAESIKQVISTAQSAIQADPEQLRKCTDQIIAKVQLTVEGRCKNFDAPLSLQNFPESDSMAGTTAAPTATACGIKAR